MHTATVKVSNPYGLHLRLASEVVKKCRNSKSEVVICKDCKYADACSILQLALLGAPTGSELEITAEGEDEEQVIGELQYLFENGGGI